MLLHRTIGPAYSGVKLQALDSIPGWLGPVSGSFVVIVGVGLCRRLGQVSGPPRHRNEAVVTPEVKAARSLRTHRLRAATSAARSFTRRSAWRPAQSLFQFDAEAPKQRPEL